MGISAFGLPSSDFPLVFIKKAVKQNQLLHRFSIF